MEEKPKTKECDAKPKLRAKNYTRIGCLFLLATLIGSIHYYYVWTLHENDTNFSHLSQLEREMSLRTEMGFYYSYYKTVVEEKPFLAAISSLMYDRLVEYPKEVNAFNRFNIYPEVLTGALYRYLEPFLNTTAHRECHLVDRGADSTPVQSCVGLGEPILFYLQAVWILAGVMVAAVFLHAVALSETLLGGLLAVVQYFANHSEATRVQWAPNERENFAAPLLFLQTWMITVQLRDRRINTSFRLQVSIFLLNCLCLLFWQFSQFIFLTQIAIFFVMEQFKIIDLKTLCIFLHSHFCGLHMAVFLLQGNDMLKSSLYTSLFMVVSGYCLFFSTLRVKVENRMELFTELWLIFLRISLVVCSAFYLKKFISDYLEVEEDSHIWELLYSKFSTYDTFHTLIYTCCEAFYYLPLSSYLNLSKTLLIPIVLVASLNVTVFWIRDCLERTKKSLTAPSSDNPSNSEDEDSGIENNAEVKNTSKELKPQLDAIEQKLAEKEIKDSWVCFLSNLQVDAAVFYNISQMVVFGLMAALVMRLKLLFVGQMCVVSSLVVNSKYYSNRKSTWIPLLWGVSAGIIGHSLYMNVNSELSILGEYKNLDLEELLHWIASETPRTAAFAGSMPTLATILLTTRRPIVAHPHYEHKEARDRVHSIYKVYGKFTAGEVYSELSALKVTFLVVSAHACHGAGRPGEFAPGKQCRYTDIWDVEYPARAGPALCGALLAGHRAAHLYRVFANSQYSVFRVHDLSVRYMPRSFDT